MTRIGEIRLAYGGCQIWSGRRWLLCDGREVSRIRYWRLFRCTGRVYGRGNGGTTFNLPDLRSVVR